MACMELCPGGTQYFFWYGCAAGKMKSDPYIYQILTQNWTHTCIFTDNQNVAPILRNVCNMNVKFANILEIFSKISRK